jgi:hypothetical protein
VSLRWRRRSSPEEMAGGGCSPEEGRRERAAREGWPAGGGKKIKQGKMLSGKRGKREKGQS